MKCLFLGGSHTGEVVFVGKAENGAERTEVLLGLAHRVAH